MSAKAKNKLTPQQRKATLNRVLHKIRPYSAFVVCSLLVAAVSVAAQLYIPILCGDAIDKMMGKGKCRPCRGAAHCSKHSGGGCRSRPCAVAFERVQQPHHLLSQP